MKMTTGMPVPYGVTHTKEGVNFSFAAPGKEQCKLILYQAGSTEPVQMFQMKKSDVSGDIFFLELRGKEISGYEYNFETDGEIILDPYARAVAGRENWGQITDLMAHEQRGRIVCQEFEWEDDKPLGIPYHNIISYSLHIRGFTKHSASQVKHKGTFYGLIEKIPYLKELGINQIQCMPIYEFEENHKLYRNYWGYGPAYYFAPKSSYAVSGDGVSELKEMVKACHQAGIEVALEMPFAEDTSKTLIESCLFFYRQEYHIDGFILNPSVVRFDVIQNEPLLAGTKIMEKRDGFQNTMRCFLKGDEGMITSVVRQLMHHSETGGIFNYITNHTGFTLNDLVSYDGKHNEDNGEQNLDGPLYNYSWNCGAEGPSRKKTVMALRKRLRRNAIFLLLSAQGTPCLLSGDEFGNSQGGNNNVYCQDNEIGWVDWSKYKKEQESFLYVKEMIQFRKEHPIFHPKSQLSGMDQLKCGIPDVSYHGENAWQIQDQPASRQLGVYYGGRDEEEEDCFIAYNMHWIKHRFALPALKNGKKWCMVMSTADGVFLENIPLKNQKEISLDGRTAAIVIGRKL